ncbi:surface-adhesin E family protein [Orbaceae bacterium ESL0727]|nr:surface-adhesin E family protein [Orbaceae bacterium ESL0727]
MEKQASFKWHVSKRCLSGIALLLLACSGSLLAKDVKDSKQTAVIDHNEKNTSLQDPRVGQQYIPVKKEVISDKDTTTIYTFIDRNSIVTHPYNNKIRIFTDIANFGPAQSFDFDDGNQAIYRSVVTENNVNCDKMEQAKGPVYYFENYFGEGKQQNSDKQPNRWEAKVKGIDQYRLLLIVCSLPLAK